MIRATSTRRLLCILVSAAMILPIFASAAEAAVATWLSPLPGQQITSRYVEVSVGYNTQSNVKVTRVELWVDGKLHHKKDLVNPETRGVCSFSWDTAKFSQGPHELTVKIYSGSELLSTVSGNGSVGSNGGGDYDVTPPTVTFANVKPGDTLKGTKNIVLKASDDSGEPPLVSLLVDNALRLLENQPPYDYDLDTTTYTDGEHELKTCAFDTAGNRSGDTVIKVSFKNGNSRPVVAALSIDSAPVDLTKLDEGAADPILPVEPTEPEATPDTAARMINSSDMVITAGTTATSVIAHPEVKVGQAIQEKVSIPAVSTEPEVTAAVDSANLKSSSQSAITGAESDRAAEPVITADASVADLKNVVASTLPDNQQSASESLAMSGTASEPSEVSSPATSDVKRMAVAPDMSLRVDGQLSAISMEANASEDMMSEPSLAGTRNMVASSPASQIKGLEDTLLALGTPSAPDILEAGASSAEPKRVQVAMLPQMKSSRPVVEMGGVVVTPPAIKKEKDSKLAKSVVSSSGRVVLRDLIAQMGGFVCWDNQAHTVVAYVNNMCIELTIGSSDVLVNGLPMTIEFAPEVLNGRTVVDARLYQMALTLVEQGGLSAEVR